jgi:predicted transglutaminase-like cysteine proteinase
MKNTLLAPFAILLMLVIDSAVAAEFNQTQAQVSVELCAATFCRKFIHKCENVRSLNCFEQRRKNTQPEHSLG